MTQNNRFATLAALLFLAVVPSAKATLATAATFDEKVENAASIILGKCVKTESQLDPSRRWILTFSTFEVEKSMKGMSGPQITIVTPGGQVGSIHQDTIGIPVFRQGTEHVLFVRNSRLGPTVLYFDQGTYNVATDDRGEKIISPVPSNVVKIDQQRGLAIAPDDTPRTLQQFQHDIDESMRNMRDRKMRMEMMGAEKRREEASLWSLLKRNKLIVILALAGIALATWHLLRR